MWSIVQRSDVWLLALVVFAAYTLYVGIYDLPAFVEKGYDKSKTYTATLGTVRDWMRPIGAIGAGLIADRFNGAKTLISLFAILILTFLSLYSLPAVPSAVGIVWVQVLVVGLAVFALRGVYFAMLEELNIPVSLTGFTVGFVSFVGFIPDLYMHLLSGYLVAYFEGVMGYHVYFAFLAVISVVGMASAAIILRQQQNAPAVVREQSAAP
jgi:sugar phosphate permease